MVAEARRSAVQGHVDAGMLSLQHNWRLHYHKNVDMMPLRGGQTPGHPELEGVRWEQHPLTGFGDNCQAELLHPLSGPV